MRYYYIVLILLLLGNNYGHSQGAQQFGKIFKKSENQPPVADAGDDIKAAPGSTINISGKKSGDPNGDVLQFEWLLPPSLMAKENYTYDDTDTVKTHKGNNRSINVIKTYTETFLLDLPISLSIGSKHVIKLTVINPSVVIGPGIGEPTQAGSLVFFQKLITKEMPVAPPFKLGLVDVRDVAKMFIGALENDDSIGKRILLAENTYWIKEYCQMLINIGHKAPTFTPPAFLVKFLSNFDKALKSIVPLLGVDMKINTELAKSLLDFEPIPIQKTIKDTSNYINNYN